MASINHIQVLLYPLLDSTLVLYLLLIGTWVFA